MDRINATLYAHRQQRPAPLRDEKILAAWNGLMISAFARGGSLLTVPAYIQRAEQAAEFIWDQMVINGRVRRERTVTYSLILVPQREGTFEIPAFEFDLGVEKDL